MVPTSVIHKQSKRKETSPRNDSDWTEASGRKAAKQRKPSSPSPSPTSQTQPANRFDALSTLDDVLEEGEIMEEGEIPEAPKIEQKTTPSIPDSPSSPQRNTHPHDPPSANHDDDDQPPNLSPSETSTPEKTCHKSELSSPPFASLANKSIFADDAKLAELASSLSSEAEDDASSTDLPSLENDWSRPSLKKSQAGTKKDPTVFPTRREVEERIRAKAKQAKQQLKAKAIVKCMGEATSETATRSSRRLQGKSPAKITPVKKDSDRRPLTPNGKPTRHGLDPIDSQSSPRVLSQSKLNFSKVPASQNDTESGEEK